MLFTSGQESCAKESSKKSMGCASAAGAGGAVCRGDSGGKLGGGIERTGKPVAGTSNTGGGLERASVTTFSEPGVSLRSVVNSEMYARWRCWRADCGGVTQVMAATSGLWSVRSWNCLPSNKNLKWRMVAKAASSSLSKVEYFASAGASFFEKKANGFQPLPTCCCRTPPTCESEALTERKSTAFGAGWQSGTAATRAALAATKAASAGDQSRTLGDPFSKSVRGWRVRATAGRKRL